MDSDQLGQEFYVVRPPAAGPADTEFVRTEPVHLADAPTCEACGSYLGMMRWIEPLSAEIRVHGGEPGDFAYASSSDFLISERTVELIQLDGLRGLSALRPVTLSQVTSAGVDRVPRYYFGEVALKGARLDEARSEVRHGEPPTCSVCCSAPIDEICGFKIDYASWSGRDFFVPAGLPGVVVVSAAARQAFEREAVSNVELVPTAEFRWSP